MTTSEVESFLGGFKTLMMASITPDGLPHASTAPFVRVGNDFYILISTIAQHGRNLLDSSDVSLLFAEDEIHSNQPFARKRVTIEAKSSEITQEDTHYLSILQSLKTKFDPTLIGSLTQMNDFHLFKLSPKSGSVVMGFGKAYHLDKNLEVMTQIIGSHQKAHGHG